MTNSIKNDLAKQDEMYEFTPNVLVWYACIGMAVTGIIMALLFYPPFSIIFILLLLPVLLATYIDKGKRLVISPQKIEFLGRRFSTTIFFSEIDLIEYDMSTGSVPDCHIKIKLNSGKKFSKSIKNWHVPSGWMADSYIKRIIEKYWNEAKIKWYKDSIDETKKPQMDTRIQTIKPELNTQIQDIKPEMYNKIETVKPKICPRCGAILGIGAIFCSQCGMRLEN